MEVLEVTGTSYPSARELPNHGGRPIAKHQKSSGNNSGGQGAKSVTAKFVPTLTGKAKNESMTADQKITEANQMVMWLVNGKCRFVRASEYERLSAIGKGVTSGT